MVQEEHHNPKSTCFHKADEVDPWPHTFADHVFFRQLALYPPHKESPVSPYQIPIDLTQYQKHFPNMPQPQDYTNPKRKIPTSLSHILQDFPLYLCESSLGDF